MEPSTNTEIAVLLIEDNPGDAFLIKELLNEAATAVSSHTSFNLTHSDHLADGLAVLSRAPFDVILLDLSLPDSYGLDTFLALCEAISDTPIILLTGFNSEQLAMEAMQLGAQDYLVKGDVDSHSLVRAIRYAIERQRLFAELSHKADELSASNAELDAFAHTVAHQIKGLLSQIVGYADFALVEYGPDLQSELFEILKRILSSGDKINTVINNLLFLSSIRSDKEVEGDALKMQPLVDEACKRLSTEINERKASITMPSQWPSAQGYGPWIEEVWVNYLSNAVKYGGDPPEIELGATSRGNGMITFWIKDNGPGIARVDQAQLFRPHIRLNWKVLHGDGVGLSIVSRIIEKSGGKVGVESEDGKGSTFWFTLPQYG